MIVYKLTDLRIKSWKKNTGKMWDVFLFHFTETTGNLGKAPRCGRTAAASAQTLTEESTWGQSRCAPLVAANNGQLNVTDFPTRDVTTSFSGRHRNHCQESLAKDVPFFFSFFFFAVATADICADLTTSRALDSRRHMVTDWVDWHQASISLMPVDLGLQMSLSLMTASKKKKKKK